MLSRYAFVYAIAVAAGIWGFAIGRYEVFPYRPVAQSISEIEKFLRGHPEEDPTSLAAKIKYHPQEQKRQFDYAGFHRRDGDFAETGFLLTTRYSKAADQVVVDLIDLNGFKRLHRWTPPIAEILERAKRGGKNNEEATGSGNFTAGHPLLLDDGGIVFNSGHGSLVKIDKCGKIVWLNDEHFHHSIERDHDGNIVAVFTNNPSIAAVPKAFKDDGFAVIGPNGKILRRYSAAKILMDNGFQALLLGIGRRDGNIIHLNDAEPILWDHGQAKIGDVALSIRHLSTVLLYRPAANKVIWLKTGPWLNQHDVNHLPDGRFSVFSNHMYRTADGNEFAPPGHNEVFVWDPEKRSVDAPYSGVLKKLGVRTATAGRGTILPNGDLFIEESRRDRILRVSQKNARWEYVNGITAETTGGLNWARYIAETGSIREFWRQPGCR